MARRRANGEGTIFQRSDGRWTATVTLRDGSRRRKDYYAKTQSAALEKLQQAREKLKRQRPLVAERTKLSEYMKRWLEDSAKAKLRTRTYQDYERIVRQHLAEIGHIPLGHLSPADVQGLINRKVASGLSASRVHAIHAVLSGALGQAEKWGMVERNIARLVEVPKPPASKIEPLSPAQLREFLASIDGHRLSALYIVAATTGLREGECLGLTWQAVNLDRGTLTVTASMQRIDGKLQPVPPKTERSRRTIVLPAVTKQALRSHRAHQLEERLKAGPLWQEQNLVFTTEFGTPIDGSNLVRQLKALLKRADLPAKRFHDFRHGVATALFSQGVHLRKVADLLGHSQIAVTSEIYTHSVEAGLQEVADKMDAALAV